MGVEHRPARPEDAAAIAAIYNHHVRDSIATFEELPVAVEAMAARLQAVLDAGLPWWVAENENGIAGYAYASPWKPRSAYRHSVESSIYLHPERTGCGIGAALYRSMMDELARLPIHAVMGGISLPNPASVALHERLGFRPVARFPEVGYKFGQWIDVGYWQWLPRGAGGERPDA